MNAAQRRSARRRLLRKYRSRIRARLEADRANRPRPSKITPAPLYDEVYFQGIEWLDRFG